MLDGGKFAFYSVSNEGHSSVRDAVGVAENTGTPTQPVWNDLGLIAASYDETLLTPRCKDPSVLRDGKKLWMVFGSHGGGVYATELRFVDNPRTLKLAVAPDKPHTREPGLEGRFTKLAQHMNSDGDESEIEAPFVFRHEEWYYLFTNFGKCCGGVKSTYSFIVVGRATEVTGPYHDHDGKLLLEGGGTSFLRTEGRFIGPGHAGIAMIKDGRYVFTYTFSDGRDQGRSKLGVRELKWSAAGWPLLGDHLVEQPPYD